MVVSAAMKVRSQSIVGRWRAWTEAGSAVAARRSLSEPVGVVVWVDARVRARRLDRSLVGELLDDAWWRAGGEEAAGELNAAAVPREVRRLVAAERGDE
mmetsp:Transcript_23349/g.78841  ORF Transcript_23349/g.78841 Transcript_23349/m.78841 type:complete len:99 (+) Transcript_23349:164-460(+)